MLKPEVVDELRCAIYEDVGIIYDLYTDKNKEEALKEAAEYVPGITMEELDEYRKQDVVFIDAVLKLAVKVANDKELLNSLFEKSPEEAYDLVTPMTGDAIPFTDFKDMLEYGGKPFFKAFEGAKYDKDGDDELSEDELDEVAGGSEQDRLEGAIIEVAEKILMGLAGCFTADSPVDTPEGSRTIKEIKEGDIVYSLDKDGNRIETKVTGKTEAEAPVINVYFSNGKVWNTTSTQWFYDGKLFHDVWQHNDRDVVTLEGAAKITDIVETGQRETVYDLIMDGTNIMFINGVAAEGYGN
jgi:hypothetical protein